MNISCQVRILGGNDGGKGENTLLCLVSYRFWEDLEFLLQRMGIFIMELH